MNSDVVATAPPRTAKVTLLCGVVVAAIFFGMTVLASLPTTIISNSLTDSAFKQSVAGAFPQGWAYFTRDPQDIEVGVYSAAGGNDSHKSLLKTPQGSLQNWFGLSRNQRAQGTEIAFLTDALPEWRPCTGMLDECLDRAEEHATVPVSNTSPLQTICGDILVTQEKIIPWSYRYLYPSATRSVEMIGHLEVTCD